MLGGGNEMKLSIGDGFRFRVGTWLAELFIKICLVVVVVIVLFFIYLFTIWR